jgi:putative addiction module CopG family antidote
MFGDWLNISVELTGNLLEYIERLVQSGLYKSRSEVIREAIRAMIQRDIREQIKVKGLDIEEFDRVREEVSGEILEKKYKGKI